MFSINGNPDIFSSVAFPLNASPIRFKPSKRIAYSSFKGCLNFTKKSSKLLNPKRSFFWMGVKNLRGTPSDQSLGSVKYTICFFMILSSPIVDISKTCLGFTGTMIGGTASALTGTASLVEKGVRRALNADLLNNPQAKQANLRNAFFDRMLEVVRSSDLNEEQKQELIDDPVQVVAVSLLALAFNSLDVSSQSLRMGDGKLLQEKDLNSLGHHFKQYFADTLEVKQKIQLLNQSFKTAF